MNPLLDRLARGGAAMLRAAVLGTVIGAAAHAQAASISPGMSRDEVVRALGKPSGERTSRGYTYLFFANGCERTCGTSDIVTLEDGQVSDAFFRKPGRVYTGTSSSPAARQPSATLVGQSATLRVAPRSRPARSSARAARGRAVRGGNASGATAGAGGQTPGLIVAPRRPAGSGALMGTDSVVTPRALADTTTSTGTRFGPPLTVAPGPRTPQTPGLGAPPSRDSTVRNGVQLPPGSVPVPFQGARPSSVDSARAANERARTPQPSSTPARPR